jgi:hypothetical protein
MRDYLTLYLDKQITVKEQLVVCSKNGYGCKWRRVWRYQRGNQNVYIEDEQTTQWAKEKVQTDKQRSTKHTYKTKYRVTRTPLKTGGELRCSGRVSRSCSTSGTLHVNLVTNPVINREWGKDREVFTTSGTCTWSFVTQIFHQGQPSHGGNRKNFEQMTSILPKCPPNIANMMSIKNSSMLTISVSDNFFGRIRVVLCKIRYVSS